MKKIVTAIGNNILNEKLKETKKYEIAGRDIQYKEGVLEYLSTKEDIDVLIISEILEGEIDFKALISTILKLNSNIDIIVFIENDNKDLRNFLYENGIYKIYKNNEIDIEQIDNILDSDSLKKTELLTEEIRKLKQIIEEQNQSIVENKKRGKITAITGSYGVRKKYGCMFTL